MESNNEMAKYIYSILLTQPVILMSWGFQRPRVIDNGLSFMVQGFKHRGQVFIRYNEGQDLFEINLLDENEKVVETINMVYFDELIETIDNRVEKTNDYNDRVDNEYFK